MAKWSFISHITDYLKRPRFGQSKAPTLWPSEATAVVTNEYDEEVVEGKCRRATYFRYLTECYNYYTDKYSMYQPLIESIRQEYIPVDNYMRWIWKQGDLYEEYCINAAKESGIYISEQVQIYIPEHNVSGKIDLVTIDPNTNLFRAVEVKSVYGYGANFVLGTPAERRKGNLGEPRGSNLMQIGLYDWWYTSREETFGKSLLTYGARDTGRYAEYEIDTSQDEDGLHHIKYSGNSPVETEQTTTKITIESILKQYEYVTLAVDSGEIPKRDYALSYSEERIETLYERGLLGKTDRTQHEKRKKQIEEGKSRVVKAVHKGDWQCNRCSFKTICYSEDGSPREI